MSFLSKPESVERFQSYLDMIEPALENCLVNEDTELQTVADAMRYSTMIGGKRIRPVLVLEFARICGASPNEALPFACALEMIHTSSLIHDDMPCMDNDDLRRGKPSCHKKYGENFALLAGDALMAEAFSTAASAELEADRKAACIKCLADSTGIYGMLGGQNMDEINETVPADAERLTRTDARKTGALIRCACEMGCLAAGTDEETVKAAADYGMALGIAFQICDDILDVTGDAQLLGKTIGSDEESNKSTYVSLLGIDEARRRADFYTKKAAAALEKFQDTDFLKDFTAGLLNRDY